MDNSFQVRVVRNFVQISRGIHGKSGGAIFMGTEPYSWIQAFSASHDIEIANNVAIGGSGIGWWSSSETSEANSYRSLRVIHNTVIATDSSAFWFAAVPSDRPPPSDCIAANNVLMEAKTSHFGDLSA